MVTKTASEIVKEAKWLSNTTNSPLTDFAINTRLLSSLYSNIYSDIVRGSNQFITVVNTSEKEFDLSNCQYLAGVWLNGIEITRSTLRDNKTGGYFIENNKLYMPAGNKTIKFAPLPTTITCPDKPEEIKEEDLPEVWRFQNLSFDLETVNSNVFYKEEIDFENLPEWLEKEDLEVTNINLDDPYMFVSYSDGSVRLYSSKDYYTEWNPVEPHEVEVIAFTSDQETGQGAIWKDLRTNKYYKGSWVPDTRLEFPNSALFDYMVIKLAVILASMIGVENSYLTNNLLPEAETKFYQTLVSQPTRVNNIIRG